MSIVLKSALAPAIRELETYYLSLRNALDGSPPNGNTSHRYGFEDKAQFQHDYTQVDDDELEKAVRHFKVAVDHLPKTVGRHARKAPNL